ncbi:MAG: hypothetical protein ACJLTB_05800 [Algoriphagus aquaeductus]|uniref:hypothetical protein n=1 Tax=Algoriphagus aquaeductus TaxID=475299 RepID=UPI00387A714E
MKDLFSNELGKALVLKLSPDGRTYHAFVTGDENTGGREEQGVRGKLVVRRKWFSMFNFQWSMVNVQVIYSLIIGHM